MAESTIKYKDTLVVVASTGSTNEAYSKKLNRLVSAYQDLPAQLRRSSFLRNSNTLFPINYAASTVARFVCHSITISHCHIYQYSLAENSSTALDVDITSSGNSIKDISSTTSTDNIELCYYA